MKTTALIALRSCELHCNSNNKLIFDMTVDGNGRVVDTDYIDAPAIGGHMLDEAIMWLRARYPSIRITPRSAP